MKPQHKLVIKFWGIAFGLSIATGFAREFANTPEIVLVTRLLGSAFFLAMYLYVSRAIKKQEEIIKASHGFIQRLFDPFYLKLILQLSTIGWTAFAVLEYFGLNKIDWLTVFMLGITIIPFALGKIPLYIKREKWRHR